MFDIEQVQLLFNIDNEITDLKISNSILYLSTQQVVYRIDLNHPELVVEFKITTGDNDQVENMFLDPKGYHLIVKTKRLNYYYIHRDSSDSKVLLRLKGFDITCAEFCFDNLQDNFVNVGNSGSILVGTQLGIVYELILETGGSKSDFFNNKSEKMLRQVYKIDEAVLGIQIKPLDETNFNVLITTVKSIQLFQNYQVLKFHHKSSNFNQLHKMTPQLIKFNGKKSVHNSKVSCSISTDDEVVIVNSQNVNINKFKIKENESVTGVILTQFHIFVLLETKLVTYNQLSNELVSESVLDGNESFLGFTSDIVEHTFWLFSSSNLYEILIENESKDIWQIMLSQGLYDDALDSLSENDLASRDLVLMKKAAHLYQNGDLLTSAEIFSKTSQPVEEVMLMFKDDLACSLKYLSGKLSNLPKNQLMQGITLSSWMVEIYMEMLNNIDNEINSFNNASILNNSLESKSNDDSTLVELNAKLQDLSKVFEKFLTTNVKTLHKETVYQIIISHNRKDELLYYANLIKDYDFVLNYYINLGRWLELLKVLLLLFGKNSNNKDNLEYVYKYASVLMMNEPKHTIETWMKIDSFTSLDFNKLLPSMTTYNKIVCNSVKPTDNEALKLLQNLIELKHKKNKSIHNTYLCLLLSYPFADGEAQILKYLEKNVGGGFNGNESKDILFDTDFILRLCNKYNKVKAMIYIFSISGDYEEAVDLALESNLIELATVIADRPAKRHDYSFVDEENDESNRWRKKLWLKIAQKLIYEVLQNDKYLIQNGNEIEVGTTEGEPVDINKKNPNIQKVLRYILAKANNNGDTKLVTIQDLLALFPDFMVIDNFKDDIVMALQEHSAELDKLSEEMNKALYTSAKLKSERQEYEKNRFVTVEPKESCGICHKLLITRKFFTYPCFHSFHQDCLVKYYKDSSAYKVKNKLYILEKQLVHFKKLNDLAGINGIKLQIDDTLNAKCAFCELKISEIDDSFPGVELDDDDDDDF